MAEGKVEDSAAAILIDSLNLEVWWERFLRKV